MRIVSLVFLFFCVTVIGCQNVPRNQRVDCLPRPNVNKEDCLSFGCLWDDFYDPSNPTVPICYWPPNEGYAASGSGSTLTLTKVPGTAKNPFGTNISPLYFKTESLGNILNVKIGAHGRYEPPIKLERKKSFSSDPLIVETTTKGNIFAFSVRRKSTRTLIWNTSIGGFIFSDKYIQIATFLPTERLYGFGENVHQTLKHNFTEYLTWGMFARDEAPNSVGHDRKNLYGVHPFYLAIESDFRAHGVFIWNSNAQEITTGPAPHLIYRTIGGLIDIYFLPGPEPEQVIQQYLAIIGTPFLPAYFALGFQLSRYGYTGLDQMMETVKRVQNYGVPLDIPYADIDYMDRYKDFTTGQNWTKFSEYAKKLHIDGLHLFLIFDPAIQVDYDTFERGIQMNASFIEWERFDQVPHEIQDLYPMTKNTKIMLGVVWPDRHVAFPDFLDPEDKTSNWWVKEFERYHEEVPFDGIWIDMNEPSNFATNEENPWYHDKPSHPKPLFCPLNGSDSEFDMPPFQTANVYNFKSNSLSTKTLCMCAMTNRGTQRFYDTKNLFGLAESIATRKAVYRSTRKRGAIISRSTFPTSGHYVGHWLGDNSARWEDLRTSVIGVQEFNLFGIPYVGTDICGFIGATTEELCLRWHQLGAFHSFSRNHNADDSPPQDPGQWPAVASAARQALLFRYHHLPYLFSLHFEASLKGGTVVRPVFFEFPEDERTHDLGYQFMWGSGMMIIPVLNEGDTTVSSYLPNEATWYSLRSSEFGNVFGPGNVQFDAPTTELIPVLARGGVIIPRQAPNTTTTLSRLNPFELLIPLHFDKSGNPLQANGKMYWDDGDSIIEDFQTYNYFHWEMQFICTEEKATLYIRPMKIANGFAIPTLDIIDVIGYGYNPQLDKAQLDGKSISISMQTSRYDRTNKHLHIETNKLINLSKGSKITFTWPHSSSEAKFKKQIELK